MKKQILFLSTVIIIIALFFGTGLLIATDIPQDMNIKSDVYKRHRKGPVPFSHQKHIDSKIACTECHHVYKDGKNVFKEGDPVQKCSACHDAKETKGKVKN